MIDFRSGIPQGFGSRLREERTRLKIKQAELGEIGGVGRVTQFEYEREARSPTIKYLNAIASAGIDLAYILFARRVDPAKLKDEEITEINKQALKMVARNEKDLGKEMDDEKRLLMFELLRSQLISMKLQEHAKIHPDAEVRVQ